MQNLIADPAAIERRSFEIIRESLGDTPIPPEHRAVVERVIHTTADFDYAHNLRFSPDAVEAALSALTEGATLITDTQMVRAGVNKKAAAQLGVAVCCFIGDPDIAEQAKAAGTTRAVAAVDKAAALPGPLIFAVGNAPTALLRIADLVEAGSLRPRLVVGVPVGFVNVVESKERFAELGVPYILSMGRKGGSNVAAAILNALLYKTTGRSL